MKPTASITPEPAVGAGQLAGASHQYPASTTLLATCHHARPE